MSTLLAGQHASWAPDKPLVLATYRAPARHARRRRVIPLRVRALAYRLHIARPRPVARYIPGVPFPLYVIA